MVERTSMSKRELERSAVLARVRSEEIKLSEAAPLLRVSYRQAKRIYARYRAEGAKGLVHRNAGRASNRSHPSSEREMVLSLVREHYAGSRGKGTKERFGPTLTAEHLFTDHGVLVPVRTLARWMVEDGLWSRTRKVRSARHQRRERKDHFGELVQLDGSFHEWLEGRGPKGCLMTMIDDATGRTLLSIGKEETTWAAANLLKQWIASYGVPRALYTDWKSVYKRAPTSNELARGELAALTQFGRMCEKLDIELIGAATPQAKGRVERAHGTNQDRLVKKLRLKGIADYAAVNDYLEDYTKAHNARFSVAPRNPVDYHLPRSKRILSDDDVFCLETTRTVGNDFVVQYGRRGLQLGPSGRGRVPVRSKVLVRETEDGLLRVIQVTGQGRERRERALRWSEAAARVTHAPSCSIPRTVTPPETGSPTIAAAEASIPTERKKRDWKPAPDHPWKMQHGRWQELARLRRAAPMYTREDDTEQSTLNQQS